MKIVRLLLPLLALLFSGCAISYFHKGDTKLLRITFGTDQILGPFELNQDGTLKLGGSSTKQGETAGNVAGSVAHAIKPSILP